MKESKGKQRKEKKKTLTNGFSRLSNKTIVFLDGPQSVAKQGLHHLRLIAEEEPQGPPDQELAKLRSSASPGDLLRPHLAWPASGNAWLPQV